MMNILIIDDEKRIALGLENIVKNIVEYDIDTRTVFDSVDALELIITFKPDLVITDIRMPVIDGLELVRISQEKGYCNHFILVTGYNEFEYARQAIKYHVEDFLLKPIDSDELIKIISRVADQLVAIRKSSPQFPRVGIFGFSIDEQKLSKITKSAITFIQNNYGKAIGRDEVAQELDISPSYLSAIFQKEISITVMQYLDYTRLKQAVKMMMKDPSKPMKVIADKTGYVNQTIFFKVFKKRVGLTPGQFKKKYSNWIFPE